MPRPINRDLLDCLQRPNPNVEYRIEVSEPDAVRILRRQDEFLGTPPLIGAMVPANGLSADARGSLILTPATAAIASFAGEQSFYDLNGEDSQRRVKGAAWTMDAAFTRAKLRSVTARVQRVAVLGLFFNLDFELQVYRITKTPGFKEKYVPDSQQVQLTAFTDYTFTPLLAPAPVIKSGAIAWDVNQKSTLNFDLSNYGLTLENTPTRAAAPDQAGELPRYYFVVRVLNNPKGTGFFRWLLDTATARTIAGVGTFQRSWWARNNDQEQWVETLFADVPCFAVNVETYPAAGEAVYAVTLPKLPDTARGSTGRAAFDRYLPPGADANLGISVSGSGGPFTPMKHGDAITGRKNWLPRGNNWSVAPWTGISSAALNAVGMDGRPNTASTLTDANAAGFSLVQQAIVIPNDNNPVAAAFWILQDADETRFPQIFLSVTGGASPGQRRVSLNTKTGAFSGANISGIGLTGTTSITPEFWGGRWWWKVVIVITNNTTGNVTATAGIYPAARTVMAGGDNVAAVGSIVVGNGQIELAVTDISTPIFTDAAAVTLGAQLAYHARLALSTTQNTLTPAIMAFGVEYRIPIDVSVEGIPQLPVREVAMPWPKASIPEGKLTIVRTGVRDYLDTAGVMGSTQPTSKLECDIYLASRHPSITRDDWLHLERLNVTNRTPGPTSETLTLLSYAAKLKKKIPQKVETLSSVHTVTASTTGAVNVNPALPGTSVGGNEYDNKGYYMRVRSTSSLNVAVGFVQTIQGNTGTGQLDFVPVMPSALNVGDVVEVHSGIFTTAAISWTDADPADVWDQLLAYAGIPLERIGIGTLPRGGRPPRVTDIAPGDAATQAKLLITNKLSEIEPTDELVAQVSAILGGVTMEMPGGQICFVQLYPLRDATGRITVPLGPVVKYFDKRDYGTSLQTPPGLEKRATVMSATYGVPLTASAPESYPKATTVTVDNDALLWLTQQDLEEFGSAQVPDKIARWLYNTSDAGLYLASALTATYVRALSTGLRVFPFNAIEKNPELLPGDSVVILTDQYTDFEPSSQTPLRGMLAIRGVLVQVGNEGRQLSMFVPGLQDNVSQARGGAAGTLTGLGTPLDPPILSGTFLPTGELVVTSQGAPSTASQRIAVGSVEPTDVFTRVSTPINLQNITGVASGLIVATGASAWIKAFAYDAYGNESVVAKVQLTRQGSGIADPPHPLLYPTNGDINDLSWNIRADARPGSGGGGANLLYELRQKLSFAVETVLSSGNATAFPLDLNVTRHPRSTKVLRLLLTDSATGLTAETQLTVPSARSELTDAGDQFTSGVKESGGKPINRLLAKALAGDPDNADSVLAGSVRRIPVLGASDATGNIDMAGSGWVTANRNAANLRRSVADATAVSTIVGQLANTGHATSTFQESGGKLINRLYAKTLAADPDTADAISSGVSWQVPSKAVQDVSGRIVTLRRSGGVQDVSADTLGANLGSDVENMVLDGGGQDGALNAQAPGWVYSSGVNLVPTVSAARFGDRALMFDSSAGAQDSSSYEDFAVVDQGIYELSGWIKVQNLAGAGLGAAFNIDPVSGISSFTILEKIGTDFNAGEPDVGISKAVVTQDWTFVRCTFRVNGTGTLRLILQQGYAGTVSGVSWFDGVKLRRVPRATNEGGARGFVGFQDLGAKLATAAMESGGVAVNRLLAKNLAADSNTLDSAPDGLTYKRTLGVISGLITPSSSTSRFRCKVQNSAAQSAASGSTTLVNFNAEIYDIGGLHDNVTSNNRITVPTGGNIGQWDLLASIEFAANAVGRREIYVTKNGVVIETKRIAALSVGGFGPRDQVVAYDTDPAVGDFYDVRVFQDSGAPLNLVAGCTFSAAHRW